MQAEDCDLFLYADDSCLIYQHKDVKEIERNLNKIFLDVCDWFVDNKLSIHFGQNKMYTIWLKTSVVLILNMTRCTLSNITQWHTLVAYWIKPFLRSQWL